VGKSPSQEQHPPPPPPPSVWLPGLSLCSYCHKGRSYILAQLGGMIGFLVLSPSHHDEGDPESRISHNPKRITNRHVSWIAVAYLHVACRRDWCFASLLLLLFLSSKERKREEREGSSSCRLISNSFFAFSWGCGVWLFRVLRTRKACYKSRLGSTIRNSSGQVLSCGAVNGDLCSAQQVDQ
jgi:hypothetical protein